MKIHYPVTFFDSVNGSLTGKAVSLTKRTISDLEGVFEDEAALSEMNPDEVIYEVEIHQPVGEIEGGLYFGTSYINPGKVGNEYFMTKGHFHAKRDRGEYYWGIAGKGLLLLMDEHRNTWAEIVKKGSLHYIPGYIAHRLINTGQERLVVGACWPADAGHDYETIQKEVISSKRGLCFIFPTSMAIAYTRSGEKAFWLQIRIIFFTCNK